MDKKDITFNSGFIIAIALFLEHKDRFNDKSIPLLNIDGAKDHLYDMEIPSNLSNNLKERIKKAQNSYLELSWHNGATLEEVGKIYKEFEDILIEVDKEIFGLKPVVKYR